MNVAKRRNSIVYRGAFIVFIAFLFLIPVITIFAGGGGTSGGDSRGPTAFDTRTGKPAPVSSLSNVSHDLVGPLSGHSSPPTGWSGNTDNGGGSAGLDNQGLPPAQSGGTIQTSQSCEWVAVRCGSDAGCQWQQRCTTVSSSPPPPPTAPTFDNTCNDSINEGNSCDITWSCADSSSSSGVNFSTGGATSGSVVVTPTETTEYTISCDNGGQASQTITVIDPQLSITATQSPIQVDTTTTITWSANAGAVNSCSVSEDNDEITDAWNGISGSQETSALGFETTYTLSCTTDAGTARESTTVKIIPFFEEF